MHELDAKVLTSVATKCSVFMCAIASLDNAAVFATDRLTLVADGKSRCCIVVEADADFQEPAKANWNPEGPLLQWAAEDLAHYLGKMSGAKVKIGSKPIPTLVPIFVGSFSEPTKLRSVTEFGDTYLVDTTNSRIVLHGESRRAVYYAAAHLLHELGVRWYGPGKTGEVVPSHRTVSLETRRIEESPTFTTRNIWCHDATQIRWMYRNRLGEPMIPCGHAAHAYARTLPGWAKGIAGRTEHSEFYALVNGQPRRMNLAHSEVVQHFATNALKTLKAGPQKMPGGKVSVGSISVSPDGGLLQDDRPEVRALNGGQIDPILRGPSFSAAWFGFLNQVCSEIDRQAPDLEFTLGSLASMNYLQPPRGLKLDPRIIPVVATRTCNRYTSIGTAGAPTSEILEEVLRDWTRLSPRVGVYLVNFIPGDMAMPYSRRRHWTNDIPKLHYLGIHDVTIESHPNWHTMMPGNFVAARLLWDPKTNVKKLLDEFYPAYYGPAAEAMRRYDATLENAYETTPVFASVIWGTHLILTSEVMATLERNLVETENLVRGKNGFQDRVEIVRFSLNFARHWFAARNALNRFDLDESEKHGTAFLANYRAATAKYPLFFNRNTPFSPNAERYFEQFHHGTFKDAARIDREGGVVYRFPDVWSVKLVPVEGDATPSLMASAIDETKWQYLKTYSTTLDEQGMTFFRGVLWYRHKFSLPKDTQTAGPLKLWFGGLDNRARVFLNGHDLAEKPVDGCFGTLELDIDTVVDRDGENVLLVAVDNTTPIALGTGGIIRPVLIHSLKR